MVPDTAKNRATYNLVFQSKAFRPPPFGYHLIITSMAVFVDIAANLSAG
jgi:hypothetical protein